MSDRVSWAMALPDFFGSRGNDVAAVNPDDLRKVWAMMRDLQARALAGQSESTSSGLYQSVQPRRKCGGRLVSRVHPGLQMLPGNPLTPWLHEGELDDAAFQIAASFPMKKLPVGLVKNGLPFDVQEIVKRIGTRT